MNDAIITINDLRKEYTSQVVLDDVSLSIAPGEAVALLGANGAGKTTLFKIILGLLDADSGTCALLGTPSHLADHRTKDRIGFISDDSALLPWASPDDIAKLYARLYSRWDEENFRTLISHLEIDADKRINVLSKGERRLTEIALATSCHPDLLILDEPFDGLDAIMRIRMEHLLNRLQDEERMTLFYSTHILAEVDKIAERIVILRDGAVLLDTAVADMPRDIEATFVDLYGITD